MYLECIFGHDKLMFPDRLPQTRVLCLPSNPELKEVILINYSTRGMLISTIEDGDDSDEDDDMEVGGMTQNFRDPLTRGWLDKPVTS